MCAKQRDCLCFYILLLFLVAWGARSWGGKEPSTALLHHLDCTLQCSVFPNLQLESSETAELTCSLCCAAILACRNFLSFLLCSFLILVSFLSFLYMLLLFSPLLVLSFFFPCFLPSIFLFHSVSNDFCGNIRNGNPVVLSRSSSILAGFRVLKILVMSATDGAKFIALTDY